MDFAKKQLEKYGWQEGKGLGKHENGISSPVKPKLKFDHAGIGHNISEQFTNNWWENLYNSASSNVNVGTAGNGNVQLNVNDPEGVEITTKSYSVKNMKKKNNNLEYGSFIKTSKLTEAGIVEFDNNNYCDSELSTPKTERPLTDEELFIACGGRTAHKGARHGLTLNGKLSRLEKQEKLLLKKLRRVSLSDETDPKSKKSLEKKLKKINDHKNQHKTETMEENINVISEGAPCSTNFSSPHKSSKKRKKERKRVSFSETVTEYQTQDPESNPVENQTHDVDSSSQSDASSRPSTPITTVVRKVKIKDVKENAVNEADILIPDQDEGIDCSDFDTTKEKDATDLQAKVREDNQKMKRKLTKLRRKCTHSDAELLELSKAGGETSSASTSRKCMKCIKRKIELDQEDCENVKVKKCHYKFADKDLDDAVSKYNIMPGLTEKELLKQIRRERRLEKRISKVADSLNHVCKISDIESE